MPSLGRTVVGLILAPCIALSATIAQEHIHEADADHPRSAVHRHLQPHAVPSHDHDHAQFAADAEHIVWLEGVALHRPSYHHSVVAWPLAERFELVPPRGGWVAGPAYDAAPPHGPPRACLSLRAPPSLPV